MCKALVDGLRPTLYKLYIRFNLVFFFFFSRYAGRAPCGKGRSTHGYARVPLVIFTSPAEISAGFFASTLNQQAHSVQGLCFRVQT